MTDRFLRCAKTAKNVFFALMGDLPDEPWPLNI